MSAARLTPSSLIFSLTLLVSSTGLAWAQLTPDLPVGGTSARPIVPPDRQAPTTGFRSSLMEFVGEIQTGVFVYRWFAPAQRPSVFDPAAAFAIRRGSLR
jgi:hypothetical protein